MVLSSFGVDIAESELRRQCDCTPYYGTDALMAVNAARQLGFAGTAKHTLTLEELRTMVAGSHHPIVFVDLSPIDGTQDIHALVVVGASQDEIIVLDPLKGERILPLQAFSTAWALRHNLAIIVER
jgi:ABC-type bacteriocin/lantibiotic exporter with double-glycine peptidase domain